MATGDSLRSVQISEISVEDLAALGRRITMVILSGGMLAWEQAGLDMEVDANGG